MLHIEASDFSSAGKARIASEAKRLHQEGHSFRSMSTDSGLSRSTLHRWCSNEMSVGAQGERYSKCGQKPMFGADQTEALITRAKARRQEHQPVDLHWTAATAKEIMMSEEMPSRSWCSKFWKKHGWPNRKATPCNEKELRPSIREEALEFIAAVEGYIRENDIPDHLVVAADETGVWTGATSRRTYVNPDDMDSSVIQSGNHRRDTVMMSFSMSGEAKQHFIRHRPMKTSKKKGSTMIIEKGVSGMGIEQMREWALIFVQSGAKVLILDGLSAHKNAAIHQIFEENGVKVFITPPQCGKMINPCDNPFFSTFKARLARYDTSTVEKKERAVEDVTESMQGEIVRNAWRHSGWGMRDESE